jgi:hypothetical protein
VNPLGNIPRNAAHITLDTCDPSPSGRPCCSGKACVRVEGQTFGVCPAGDPIVLGSARPLGKEQSDCKGYGGTQTTSFVILEHANKTPRAMQFSERLLRTSMFERALPPSLGQTISQRETSRDVHQKSFNRSGPTKMHHGIRMFRRAAMLCEVAHLYSC